MHIPDGFLSTGVWGTAWGVSAAFLSVFIKKATSAFKDKMVPLAGVMAAFIFAAQMLNFPVASGTSGHFLGAALAAILLGPWIGAVVITVVVVVQCFVFLDGGVTALGANILNMAIIGSLGGFVIYWLVAGVFKSKRGILIGAAVSGWITIVVASVFCAFELGFSGVVAMHTAVVAMAMIHALIGIGEAIITVLVVSFILKVRPDLIYRSEVLLGGKK